ncbi:MAG: hypothetical protein C0417_06275 [Chlorobiaceae bacterium]|nr:hypothetical protein [Chlorobiaceae bacterium]
MKFVVLFYCCLLLFICDASANYFNVAEASDSSFEIIGRKSLVRILPDEQRVECIDTMTLHRKDAGEKFVARFIPIYHIDAISISGDLTEFKFENGLLAIEGMPEDSIIEVILHYQGEWKQRSEFSTVTKGSALLRDVELFPIISGILRTVRLTIDVPDGWKTITVGELKEVRTVFDRSIQRWECDQPLSEIGWICAGMFWLKDSQSGKINYSCYGNENDSSLISSAIPLARDAIEYYSSQFNPYRFKKLSIVEVEDWVAGSNVLAIAAPSFILVKQLAFTTNDQFNRIESILAHEIAHQWWPLTVFIDRSDAAFLAEGMCEYSSILFHKEKGLMTGRDSLSHHPLLRPLLMRAQSGQDIPLQRLIDLRTLTTHYLKATYVHHMLRSVMGDSGFMRLFRAYAERFKCKKVRLEDFESLAESLSSKSLEWFFNQWVRKSGIPRMKIYNVRSVQSDSGWRTKCRVRILGYDKFSVACNIGVTTIDGLEIRNVSLGLDSGGRYINDVPFEMITNKKPTRIQLDPAGDFLKMQKLPAKISDLREPSDGVMIIGTQLHSRELHELATHDSSEMQKAGWTLRVKPDSVVTLRDLQSERVFIYGKPNENKVAAEIKDKFTQKFRNDSLIINNEMFFDSSSALIEAIDNPYFANGLIIRIVPFSENAKPELMPYDYSWIIVRGRDKIESGVWDVVDDDLVVEIK